MNNKSAFIRGRGLWIVSLILIAVLVLQGNVQSYATPLPLDDEPFESVALPLEALSLKSLPDAKVRPLKNQKLDSSMAELVSAAAVSNQSALALAESKSLRLFENRVHVQILTDAALLQNAIRVVSASGGEVTKVSNDSSVIQGWLPIGALETVAMDENVYLIRQPAGLVLFEDIKAGNSTTEGLAVLNGSTWHSAGYTGTGVKIGIIDGGFQGSNDLLGTDLPASVIVKNFVDGEVDGQVDGTTIHGTACAEIIYDIAPGANLYLAKIDTNLDLQEAVAWLKDTIQVDIISTSMGWYNQTPGDGTGEFADLVQSARDAGILWATAAGNDREAHWGGAYSDSDGNDVHNFDGDQEINYFGPGDGNAWLIPSGYLFKVALRWDDWTVVDQDFDLYLWRWNGDYWDQIAFSEDWQAGIPGQMPTEYAAVLTSGSDAPYGFTIECYSCSRAVNLEVFAPKLDRLDEIVFARSLANLADSPAAMTVAALDVVSPYPQESYSSEGPTNGPGGTAAGGFNKPDISGFANVSTESYGPSYFNGTSAATPHVAGAAALVLSAYPAYTPGQLQTYLEGQAIDMGAAGVDSIFGYGRLYLGSPPVSGPIVTNISPVTGLIDTVVPVTITGTSFVDGATVKLTRSGQTDISATSIDVVSATTITADLNLSGAAAGSWNVVVTNPDMSTGQLTDGFTVTEDLSYLFLPMLLKNFPVIPSTPVLNAIDNADGNGSYTVSWSASDNADTYTLQEDDNAAFTSPTDVYSGSGLSKAFSGKGLGTYYYRVKASNAYRESDWSNVRSVVVSEVPQPGDWEIVTIPGTAVQGEYSSIALDQNGYPNISFMGETEVAVKFVHWDGDSWEGQTIDTLQYYLTNSTSLALNANDQPLITYPYNNPLYLRLKEWDGLVWNQTTIDILAGANYAEIELKANDDPCISYFVSRINDITHSMDYNIELLCRSTGVWPTMPTVVVRYANYTSFLKARFHSMELDSLDRPHISFTRNFDGHQLRYASFDTDYYGDVVDDSTDVGYYSSLALDSQEYPHISYYDFANGNLKFAQWNGSAWLIETVDSMDDVGSFTSLALDGSEQSAYQLLRYDQWQFEVCLLGR